MPDKPKVRQGDTPYSITQETSDESTGKVSQEERPVTYEHDLDTKPSGKAKPSGPTTSYFDDAVERPKETAKAVTTEKAENKSVTSASTKRRR